MSTLSEIIVQPHELLLDPNNPRLFERPLRRLPFSPKEIMDADTQKNLLSEISKEKHGLKDLIYSIESQGFVNLDTLLVKPLAGTGMYLVLEGNRRTAAIKTLLSRSDVDPVVKRSLRNLAVKQLHVLPGEIEDEEVQKIISMRHLAGPKEWSPIARASAIYKNYMLQHEKLLGGSLTGISERVLDHTALVIGMPKAKVKLAMAVFALYQELLEGNFGVKVEHFSLLEMLVKSRRMASDYFGFNSNLLRTFDDGLNKVSDFFVTDDRVVHNPQEFRKVARIFRDGTPVDMELIRSGARSMDQVIDDLNERRKDKSFKDSLDAVKTRLETLSLGSYQGTDSEAVAIMSIKRLIDNKFVPLARQQLGLD